MKPKSFASDLAPFPVHHPPCPSGKICDQPPHISWHLKTFLWPWVPPSSYPSAPSQPVCLFWAVACCTSCVYLFLCVVWDTRILFSFPLWPCSAAPAICAKPNREQRGWRERGSSWGGGRKLKGSGWMGGMVGRKEGSIEKERRPFDIWDWV